MESKSRRERAVARRAVLWRRRLWLAAAVGGLALVAAAVLIVLYGGPDNSAGSSDLPLATTAGVASTFAVATSTTTAATAPSTSVPSTSTSSATSTSSTAVLTAAPIVRTGPADHKWVALTFDDNYQLPNAYKTLEVLVKYEVPATMFVIGHYVDLGPDLARQIAADGFEVGDHTRSHCDCTSLSKRALRIEIGNGTDHYRALTGAATVPLFRPPGGYVDQKTCEVAAEKGFRYVVLWDIDTNDWRGHTAAQITENVIYNVHNGAIVLMHLSAAHTAEALPNIIKRLRAAGYELVSLSTMLGL